MGTICGRLHTVAFKDPPMCSLPIVKVYIKTNRPYLGYTDGNDNLNKLKSSICPSEKQFLLYFYKDDSFFWFMYSSHFFFHSRTWRWGRQTTCSARLFVNACKNRTTCFSIFKLLLTNCKTVYLTTKKSVRKDADWIWEVW